MAEQQDCFLKTEVLMITKPVFPLRLRSTFNPYPSSPHPPTPAIRSGEFLSQGDPPILCQTSSLLSKEGLFQDTARSEGPQIFVTLSAGHFSKCPWTQQTKLPEKSPTILALLHLSKNGWLLQISELLKTPSATTLLLEFEHDFFCLWVQQCLFN